MTSNRTKPVGSRWYTRGMHTPPPPCRKVYDLTRPRPTVCACGARPIDHRLAPYKPRCLVP